MITAILYAPDWPGDEIVLVMEPDEAEPVIDLLQKVHRGCVGGRIVAILDRTWFQVLRRQLASRLAMARDGAAQLGRLGRLDPLGRLDRLGALDKALRLAADSLSRAAADDRAGDPAPPPAVSADLPKA